MRKDRLPSKKQGRRCLLITLLALLAGCAMWEKQPIGPGINKEDYKESCGGCHKLPDAKSRSDEEWQTYLMEHRHYSGQDEETAQLFIDYLKERN